MNTPLWLFWAFGAVLCWGLWGLLPKMATNNLSPANVLFWESIGAAIFGIILALCSGAKPEIRAPGVGLALLVGIVAIAGSFCNLHAAKLTEASKLVPITALYPILTVIFAALLLKEEITPRLLLAVLLSIGATLCIAWPKVGNG